MILSKKPPATFTDAAGQTWVVGQKVKVTKSPSLLEDQVGKLIEISSSEQIRARRGRKGANLRVRFSGTVASAIELYAGRGDAEISFRPEELEIVP